MNYDTPTLLQTVIRPLCMGPRASQVASGEPSYVGGLPGRIGRSRGAPSDTI
jgi:hypothetical protein